MSKVLSLDLRIRVLEAVAEGLSHRTAGARLGVSAASISRWRRRARVEGDPLPRALGGDRRSGRIEAHRALILGVLAETPTAPSKSCAVCSPGAGSTLAMARSSASSSATG